MSRTRSYGDGPFPLGGLWSYERSDLPWLNDYLPQAGPLRDTGVHSCIDEVGFPLPHALDISHVTRKYTPINGKHVQSPVTWTVKDIWPFPATGLSDLLHGSYSVLDTASATAKTLARTSPGRADMQLFTSIAELKDLPRMLKDSANFLNSTKPPRVGPGSSGQAYLSWKFGWEPIMRDLGNLLNAQALIDRRVNELNQLYQNGGLSRRFNLGKSGTSTTGSNLTFHTWHGISFTFREKVFTEAEQWGTVRWVPTATPTPLTPPALRKLAADAAFGKSGNHISDVYNLIPWSWLLDWTSNLGDFLESHANRVPVMATNVCVMTHVKTTRTWERTDAWKNTFKGGEGTTVYETKSRRVGIDSPSVSIPFLNGGQLSILGALISSRSKARR